ncbi:MAG: MFS transporter [Chitinophagaceae bacterium]|nr:MAG: MFS transporter [Chitinophagaceae bacterium]
MSWQYNTLWIKNKTKKRLLVENKKLAFFNATVIVAALGYFVDIYDLLLFGIIRIPSLKELGLTADQITTDGEAVLSFQMFGLMIGGILWGVLGDKKGRLSVLFGSILLYSLANIANGFVQDVEQYKWIRLLAGIGLAGELGAGITLVSEIMPKEKRGLATSFVAGFGILGAVVAFFIKEEFHWRTCYFIGGGLGIILLILRISVVESGVYNKIKEHSHIQKGNLMMLFSNKKRLVKYIKCIMIGMPTWLVVGIMISFSSEFAKHFGIQEPVDPGKAIMYAYIGLALGDILIGVISQWLKSRLKALFIFYGLSVLLLMIFFTTLWNSNAVSMYWVCGALGFASGYWAIFVTIGAEHFGTNLRATAATTIPNFVRGLLAIFIIPLFKFFRSFDAIGYVNGAIITSVIVFAITIYAAMTLDETFHVDMDYQEE